MALETQQIEIPLVGGVSTKAAEQIVQQPKLLDLRDADMSEPGKLKKRAGHTALTKPQQGGVNLARLEALLSSETELHVFQDGRGYVWSAGQDKWQDHDAYVTSTRTRSEVVHASTLEDASACQAVYHNGVVIYYSYGTNRAAPIELRVIDYTTGALLLPPDELNPVNDHGRFAVVGDTVMLFDTGGGSISTMTLDTTDVAAGWSSRVTVVSDVLTGYSNYDLATADDGGTTYVYLSYTADIGGGAATSVYKVVKVDVAGSVIASDTLGNGVQARCVEVYPLSPASTIAVVWGNDAVGSIQWALFTTGGSASTGLATYASGVTADNLTASGDASILTLFWEVTAADPQDRAVAFKAVNFGTSTFSSTVTHTGYGLAHDAFMYRDRIFVGLAHQTDLESVYLTCEWNGSDDATLGQLYPVGKYLSPQAGGLRPQGDIAQVTSTPNSTRTWAAVSRFQVFSENGELQAKKAVTRCDIAMGTAVNWRSELVGGRLYVSGGVPQTFSGGAWADVGWVHSPPAPTLSENGSGSLSTSGTYLYVLVYEWRDSEGRLYRSPVSEPTSITMTGDSQVLINHTSPPVSLAKLRDDIGSPALVAIYRTVDAGTVYYRVTGFDEDPMDADGAGGYLDGASDASIQDNEVLYTTGGELDHYAPPPTDYFAQHQERLWAISSETGDLWPSGLFIEGEGPWWHPALVISTERRGRKPTALASLDDKLVVFWEREIGYLYGEGPNNTGAGGAFSPIFPVQSDVGCTEPRSVLTTPSGVFFKSSRGIYMLGRDLSVQYVGAEVEDFNGDTIVAANLVQERHEARFVTSNGRTLVYEYLLGQWWVDDIFIENAIGACVWNDAEHLAFQNGAIWAKDSAADDDGGARDVSLEVTTPWLALSGVVGYQRVRRVWILGEFSSEVDGTTVQIGYDGSSSYDDSYTFTGAGAEEEVSIQVPSQKCRSLRLKITGATALTRLRLEIGTKRGGYKPVDRRL